MSADICCGLASNNNKFGSPRLTLVPHEPCCNPDMTKCLVREGCKMVLWVCITFKKELNWDSPIQIHKFSALSLYA